VFVLGLFNSTTAAYDRGRFISAVLAALEPAAGA
jgi:hypothetical protein